MRTEVRAICAACRGHLPGLTRPSAPPSTARPWGPLRLRARCTAIHPCSKAAYLFQQLMERSCDLRPGERFGDQQGFLRFPGTEARVSRLRCVADDHYGKLDVLGTLAHRVEERFAHVIRGTIEDERVRMLLSNHFINGCCVTARKYFVSVVS